MPKESSIDLVGRTKNIKIDPNAENGMSVLRNDPMDAINKPVKKYIEAIPKTSDKGLKKFILTLELYHRKLSNIWLIDYRAYVSSLVHSGNHFSSV